MAGVKQELEYGELALELLVESSRLSRMPTVIEDRYKFCIEHYTMSGLQIDFCLVMRQEFFYFSKMCCLKETLYQ